MLYIYIYFPPKTCFPTIYLYFRPIIIERQTKKEAVKIIQTLTTSSAIKFNVMGVISIIIQYIFNCFINTIYN